VAFNVAITLRVMSGVTTDLQIAFGDLYAILSSARHTERDGYSPGWKAGLRRTAQSGHRDSGERW
jgi:hypothetical protein